MPECDIRRCAVSQRCGAAQRRKVIDGVFRFMFGMRFQSPIDCGCCEKGVGNAGVQPARSKWSKDVSGFSGQQNSSLRIGERIRDRLPEDVGRYPRDAIRVVRAHNGRQPPPDAVDSAECFRDIPRMALQIDSPVTRKRNEEDVSPARTWMLIMKHALDG